MKSCSTPPVPNQNLVIAQVVNFLNANGCTVTRHENNGRYDVAAAAEVIAKMLVVGAYAGKRQDVAAKAVADILAKFYRPVPSSVRGFPDVVGFDEHGRFVGIEVKRLQYDSLRPEQEAIFRTLRSTNFGQGWVVRDIESFRNAWLHPQFRRSEAIPGVSQS